MVGFDHSGFFFVSISIALIGDMEILKSLFLKKIMVRVFQFCLGF